MHHAFFKGKDVVVLCYDDDLLVMGPSKDRISEVKRELARRLPTKDLGPVNNFLGIRISRLRNHSP